MAARSQLRALVIEDDQDLQQVLCSHLREEGLSPMAASTGREARKKALSRRPAVMVIDRKLPDMDGVRLLRGLRSAGISSPALIVTAHPTFDSAVEALGLEAADYIVKPVEPRYVAAMARGLIDTPTIAACEYLWDTLRAKYNFDHAFSASPAVQRCYSAAARVRNSDAPILIEGETGVGKEFLARAVHLMGARACEPFVAVNCAAVPETLLETELFGHEKGAFTSASARKKGLAEEANGGTLFLDEVGEMSPGMQAKLLRFLDEGAFRRLGGTELISVDLRIICATNRNLLDLVAEGRFRADLYYRIAVIPLYLPPLRERPEDIELFAEYFCRRHSRGKARLSPEALERLRNHSWPGNLRELNNVIRRAVLLRCGEVIAARDLSFASIGR